MCPWPQNTVCLFPRWGQGDEPECRTHVIYGTFLSNTVSVGVAALYGSVPGFELGRGSCVHASGLDAREARGGAV